jgi:hypothetical protein
MNQTECCQDKATLHSLLCCHDTVELKPSAKTKSMLNRSCSNTASLRPTATSRWTVKKGSGPRPSAAAACCYDTGLAWLRVVGVALWSVAYLAVAAFAVTEQVFIIHRAFLVGAGTSGRCNKQRCRWSHLLARRATWTFNSQQERLGCAVCLAHHNQLPWV